MHETKAYRIGVAAYRERAERHRPQDAPTLAREARRLAELGLRPRDIGAALGIEPAQVAGWLDGVAP